MNELSSESLELGSRSRLRRPSAVTDEELLKRSLKDPTIFTSVVELHSDRLFRYLQYRLSAHEAEDALSAVWEVAFRRRRSFSPERGTVVGWLYGIARNSVSHQRRSAAQRFRLNERLAGLRHRTGSDPQAEVTGAESIASAIDALRQDDREIIELVIWEGLSYADAAQAASVPIGTVRSRLSRARQKLRTRLED